MYTITNYDSRTISLLLYAYDAMNNFEVNFLKDEWYVLVTLHYTIEAGWPLFVFGVRTKKIKL